MGSTLGACGDVNRNVCVPAAPFAEAARPDYAACSRVAEDVADLLAPQSGAYYDVWLDGEKFASSVFERPEVTKARDENTHGTNFVGSPEPIYGAQFLPRKFKVAVTIPGDNSVDLFTNDLGIVLIMDPSDPGEVLGADIVAGGGMGRSHRAPTTYPRLADPLGYVPKDRILAAVKAVVATQVREEKEQESVWLFLIFFGFFSDNFLLVFLSFSSSSSSSSSSSPPSLSLLSLPPPLSFFPSFFLSHFLTNLFNKTTRHKNKTRHQNHLPSATTAAGTTAGRPG